MIKQFQGEYRWLSNFVPCNVVLDGIAYQSVEHAYQSAKSELAEWKKFCASPDTYSAYVKKASRKIKPVDNWDTVKVEVMTDLLLQKFSQEPYKQKLLDTGDLHIQEGNTWGDTFWGVDLRTGKGQNILGKMIMEIRSKLTKKDKL